MVRELLVRVHELGLQQQVGPLAAKVRGTLLSRRKVMFKENLERKEI